MAKKVRYFYLSSDGVVIAYLGKGTLVPKNCTEVTKADYDRYCDIRDNVEQRDGYICLVTLYVDFSFTVEYIPVEEEIEE